MSTGDETLDFVLQAGPRAVSPDTPGHVVEEIGKTKCLSPFREAMKAMKLERRAKVLRMIKRTCRENRFLEELYHATPTILPEARIPLDLVFELEAENNQAWSAEMREDTLRCYPGLRLNVKRGIGGLSYVNGINGAHGSDRPTLKTT